MATLVEHPPVTQRETVAQTSARAVAVPQPAPADGLAQLSPRDWVVAALLAFGEYGAMAHGFIWQNLLRGLPRHAPEA